MSGRRIKISGAANDFESSIRTLRSFDNRNQVLFSNGGISATQFRILLESTFFRAFREYENLVRDIFILYAQEKERVNGRKVKSYLNPRNFLHAEEMIRSSSRYIDWNSPDAIIERAELYLYNGYPIKLPYSSNRVLLKRYKVLRNHIAHNSTTSMSAYKKVLKQFYGVVPVRIPSVGEYLSLTSKEDNSKYHLMEFLDFTESIASQIK